MNEARECGCKGCRTCLLCENKYGLNCKPTQIGLEDSTSYVFCCYCNKAWPGWNIDDYKKHPYHEGTPIEYSGVFVGLNFLTEDDERNLIQALDEMPWDLSQSGRRKQNFGPKCNFKKRKLRLGDFNGFPKCTQFVQAKLKNVPILKDFKTIEQCSLEYDPERGASIDPHVDDCWIWGERIVTVNLLSDSVLTMTANANNHRYNLDCVETYPTVIKQQNNVGDSAYKVVRFLNENKCPIIRIPMPRRSLLVIYGSARYDWEHQVLREDIKSRRLCLAYREFTPPYLESGNEFETSRTILEKAQHFF